MVTAVLRGPDIVEVTFSTDVAQIDTRGTTVTSKTIVGFLVQTNKISYKITPPAVKGEVLYFDYTGNGNLVALPTYDPVDDIHEKINNKIKNEYLITLDGQAYGRQEDYILYNTKINPQHVLVTEDKDFLSTIDDDFILVDALPTALLYGIDGEEIVTYDYKKLVVDPYN